MIKTQATNPEIVTRCSGTSLRGYIDISYQELVELFGKPTSGDGHKVDAEWVVIFPDDIVCTIYNYKDGKNYNGANGIPTEQIRNWHVGGKHQDVVHILQNYIASKVTI